MLRKIGYGSYPSSLLFNENFGTAARALLVQSLNSDSRPNFVDYGTLSSDVFTKSNFTYSSTIQEYYAKGSVTATLTTPSLAGNGVIGGTVALWDYRVYTLYDECDDSSADTSLWDFYNSSWVSEDSEKLSHSNGGSSSTETVYCTAKGTDMQSLVNSGYLVETYLTVSGNGGTVNVILTDGTNSVTLASGISGLVQIYFTPSGSQAFVSSDGSLDSSSPVDISSVTGTTKLKIQGVLNGGSSYLNVYFLRVIKGSESSTVTLKFSGDDGTNYSSLENGFVELSSNTGFAAKHQLSATVASGEVVSVRGLTAVNFTNDLF